MASSVREACESDIPRLLQYAKSFLEFHPVVSTYQHDMVAMEQSLRAMMQSPDAILLVNDHGALGAVLTPMWCCPSMLLAVELFWWASRDGRQLMSAFEEWARERGAMPQMTLIRGVKDVGPLYERAGYVPVETAYVRSAN